ncbi:unnamed protein product, partial [marine sediment metagenome]
GGMSFDLGGYTDLFDMLRGSRGLESPLFQSGYQQPRVGVSDVLTRGQSTALGAFQRPVGNLYQSRPQGGTPTGAVFTIGPSGERRGITPGAAGAFDLGNVEFLLPEQMARISRGKDISDPSYRTPPIGGYGAFGQPLSVLPGMLDLAKAGIISMQEAHERANAVGFLPRPGVIASEFLGMEPSDQLAILTAYEFAGVPRESFEAAIGRGTPAAGAFGGRRIGFTGGWMG